MKTKANELREKIEKLEKELAQAKQEEQDLKTLSLDKKIAIFLFEYELKIKDKNCCSPWVIHNEVAWNTHPMSEYLNRARQVITHVQEYNKGWPPEMIEVFLFEFFEKL